MATPVESRWIYDFSASASGQSRLLGETGARFALLAQLSGSFHAPAGFTLSSEACSAFRTGAVPPGFDEQIDGALDRLERATGTAFDDPDHPLLVSIRPSYSQSISKRPVPALIVGFSDDRLGSLINHFGEKVVLGLAPAEAQLLTGAGQPDGGTADSDASDPAGLPTVAELIEKLRHAPSHQGKLDPRNAVTDAIRAICTSHTSSDRPDTAVVVQSLICVDSDAVTARGVASSRDNLTGEARPSGTLWLAPGDKQGLQSRHATSDLEELNRMVPGLSELAGLLKRLEKQLEDMQEIDFAVVNGRLFLLNARNSQRSPAAMVRFACDAVDEGLLTKAGALEQIDAGALDRLLHATFDPIEKIDVLTKGVAASPGAAKGHVAFTVQEVREASAEGRDVIFVRRFADADDVAAFSLTKGVLTTEGGMTSHAAMVARGMACPAVVGAGDLDIDLSQRTFRQGTTIVSAGDLVAIDGGTGVVTLNDVSLVGAHGNIQLERVLGWADAIRTLGVRVNADIPHDAEQGLSLGAEGIGVCRTEHMFMRADQQPMMRAMIMASTPTEREAILKKLLPAQQSDFEGLFEAMGDRPVTIRLLDPPLHEFLPDPMVLARRLEATAEHSAEREDLQRELDLVLDLTEVNPMLGTRGCRLGIVRPEIYEMQVEAIMRAARAIGDRTGQRPRPEVMIPLVAFEKELEIIRTLIDAVASRHNMRKGADYKVGTMIELPRACLAANQLAAHAEFFSFGTNDLTQTALGFSRDDVEADFVTTYLEQGVLDCSPFQTIDSSGVGELVRIAVDRGREFRPDISLGVCGEHGGDPASIQFFHRIGVDYVSCSLYRLPVARVAAAQAELARRREEQEEVTS